MPTIRDRRQHLYSVVAGGVVLLAATQLSGCGGASSETIDDGRTAPGRVPDAPPAPRSTTAVANEWIDMIEEAGLTEYAELGREILRTGSLRIVSPATLNADFNAFAHINTREIWISTLMFERYPSDLDQATIFLHELIHIKSGEITHLGPWWSAQSAFRAFYRDREIGAAVITVAALHDHRSRWSSNDDR